MTLEPISLLYPVFLHGQAKEEGGATGGGKGKKKSELIREKLDAKKQVDDVEDDVQIITNVLAKFKRSKCIFPHYQCTFD